MSEILDGDTKKKISKAFKITEEKCDEYNKFYQKEILPRMYKKFLAHMVSVVEDLINNKFKDEKKHDLRRYNIKLSDKPCPKYGKSYTWCLSQGAAVTYNSDYDIKSIRVLIAHELGHLLLEHKIISDKQTENNANLFAYCAISEKNDFYVNLHSNEMTNKLVYKQGGPEIVSFMQSLCPIKKEDQTPDQSYKPIQPSS